MRISGTKKHREIAELELRVWMQESRDSSKQRHSYAFFSI